MTNQPFFASANRVIRMYTCRQEHASKKAPAHSPAEISFVRQALEGIALAAAYAAHDHEYLEILRLTRNWPHDRTPDLFVENSEEAQS